MVKELFLRIRIFCSKYDTITSKYDTITVAFQNLGIDPRPRYGVIYV